MKTSEYYMITVIKLIWSTCKNRSNKKSCIFDTREKAVSFNNRLHTMGVLKWSNIEVESYFNISKNEYNNLKWEASA